MASLTQYGMELNARGDEVWKKEFSSKLSNGHSSYAFYAWTDYEYGPVQSYHLDKLNLSTKLLANHASNNNFRESRNRHRLIDILAESSCIEIDCDRGNPLSLKLRTGVGSKKTNTLPLKNTHYTSNATPYNHPPVILSTIDGTSSFNHNDVGESDLRKNVKRSSSTSAAKKSSLGTKKVMNTYRKQLANAQKRQRKKERDDIQLRQQHREASLKARRAISQLKSDELSTLHKQKENNPDFDVGYWAIRVVEEREKDEKDAARQQDLRMLDELIQEATINEETNAARCLLVTPQRMMGAMPAWLLALPSQPRVESSFFYQAMATQVEG